MLTQNRAREVFNYDKGNLVWKSRSSRPDIEGFVAGFADKRGYIYVKVDKKKLLAHRVVWLYHHGYWPENELDHINRNKSDNRIENLREVSHYCNMRNKGNGKNNTSGVKGVSPENGGWRAQIKVRGKVYSLETHADFDEAVLHRLAAEQCLGWEGCDSASPAYRYAVKHKLIRG